MNESDEIDAMMRAVFADLGLSGATDSEVEDLISIHGRALGGCALEFKRDLDKDLLQPDLPEINTVLAKVRTSFFDSPVSGKALIAELAETVSAESLRYLLLAAHLAVRAAGIRSTQKSISLVAALDDVVTTIGQKATLEWQTPNSDVQEAWCRCLFIAAQETAEIATGETFFRSE